MRALLNKIIVSIIFFTFCALVRAGDIHVTVENLSAGKGKLYTSLCLQQHFMQGRCNFEIIKKVEHDTEFIVFNNITPGNYAVSIFYDVNENEKLDSSLFGIPEEPTGVSQNVIGKNGPPAFKDAKFIVEENKKIALTIQLF